MYGLFLLTLIVLWSASTGAFLTPDAYTQSGVMAVNGSNANGDCPMECVVLASGINTCDCTVSTTLRDEAITASVLIDGVVPTIDTSERNSADEFVWAAPLLTVRASTGSVTLGFRFQTRIVLCEVELYVFHCPAWGIGAADIAVHTGATFPHFITFPGAVGRVILTSDMQNCTFLTRVSIPLQMATRTSSYFIEINSLSGTIEWVHIAEVRFSDQFDSTTMAPTTSTSTGLDTTTSEDATTFSTSEFPSTQTSNPEMTSEPHTTLLPDTSSTTSTSSTSQPTLITTSSNSTIVIQGLVVVIVVLLLIAAGGVVFTCVLRARSSRSEVRGDTDRVYDTIQEREVIATERNTAYGHVSVGDGVRMTRSDAGAVMEAETDVEYEEIKL